MALVVFSGIHSNSPLGGPTAGVTKLGIHQEYIVTKAIFFPVVNSLAPEIYGCDFKNVISEHVLRIKFRNTLQDSTPYNTNVGVQKNLRSCYMETHGSEKK